MLRSRLPYMSYSFMRPSFGKFTTRFMLYLRPTFFPISTMRAYPSAGLRLSSNIIWARSRLS